MLLRFQNPFPVKKEMFMTGKAAHRLALCVFIYQTKSKVLGLISGIWWPFLLRPATGFSLAPTLFSLRGAKGKLPGPLQTPSYLEHTWSSSIPGKDEDNKLHTATAINIPKTELLGVLLAIPVITVHPGASHARLSPTHLPLNPSWERIKPWNKPPIPMPRLLALPDEKTNALNFLIKRLI